MKETHGETHEGSDSFWIFCGQTTRAQNEANFYGNHSEEYDLWVDVSGGSKELFPWQVDWIWLDTCQKYRYPRFYK